jgi:hypothetical protein
VKVKNAQNAGARAVIVVDNVPSTTPAGLGGDDATITIPSVRVTNADGELLKAHLPAVATLGPDASVLAGADNSGRALLYAPSEVDPGSSVSHLDTSATPNVLMEPNINGDLPHEVDLTLEMMRDIGWFGTTGGPGYQPTFVLGSSARAKGKNGAFFTTDLSLANPGEKEAHVALRFLGNNRDGGVGPLKNVTIPAGRSTSFPDVLHSLFELDADFGAIQVTSDVASLNVLGQTSTPPPDGQGTFGQSVPAAAAGDIVVHGTPRSIPAIREDSAFRTNLIVVNVTEAPLDVDLVLLAPDGTRLGSQRVNGLRPLEMRQLSNVANALAGAVRGPLATPVTGGTLVLSTPTSGGGTIAQSVPAAADTKEENTSEHQSQ